MDLSCFIHEIKNSLGNIKNLTELLQDLSDFEEHKRLIIESTNRINQLCDDYVKYAISGIDDIQLADIQLYDFIIDILNEYEYQIKNKKLQVIFKCYQSNIKADPTKLKQVLHNIISNAIKYNSREGILFIECKNGNKCVITIKDTGIGMTKDEIRCIGTPLYRSQRTNAEGTGLGLSIVKKIADQCKWMLDIKSMLGIGTAVTLVI